MTRAREVGGASVAARRLLVLAGAVAGFWLVSWLTSGNADAAPAGVPGAVDPIGAVVGVLAPPDHASQAKVGAASRGGQRVATQLPRPVAEAVEPVTGGAVARPVRPDSRAGTAAVPAGTASGAAVGPVARAAGVAAAPVARVVGTNALPGVLNAPAGVAPVARLGGSAAPVARAAGSVASPLRETTTAVLAPVTGVVCAAEPATRAVGAVIVPVSATAGAVVGPVVRSAVPVVEPVSSAAKALLSPLAKTAGALVEPVVAVVAAPVTGLVDALGSVVEPVTRPVLGTASPVLTDFLTPVADGAGAPVAEFAAAPVADFAVQAVLPLARVVTSPPANQQLVPTAAGRPAAADAQGRPISPTCVRTTATAAAGPRRGAAHHPEARLGGHRRGQAPAHPGGPVSSPDVASGGGSSFPHAFLAAGHAPHHFRASPWTHGDFVPLWRPSEPGTGPG